MFEIYDVSTAYLLRQTLILRTNVVFRCTVDILRQMNSQAIMSYLRQTS